MDPARHTAQQWGNPPHDSHDAGQKLEREVERLDGALIVGAGPSGMAAAVCLQERNVPCVILERSNCIAQLWQKQTYDRLHLHIAKQHCELPGLRFPESYPTFLSRKQFLDYLEAYAEKFHIRPRFNVTVQHAEYDKELQAWCVSTTSNDDPKACTRYIAAKWLVVATGENAEAVVPQLPGTADFRGTNFHSSRYKNGVEYVNKRVLVVGSGNTGMEIALDLCNSGAKTSIAVRSPLHVLPRRILGMSTFSVAMSLTKIFPIWFVDYLLVTYSQFKLGNTSAYGLRRPKVGPLELKNKMRKTPILDVGTLSRIQSGHIQVRPGVECLTASGARFVDGTSESYDVVILATGYKSAVPRWLEDDCGFFNDQGFPRSPSENWKGQRGLYAAGLSGKGLLGATKDARLIAEDIMESYISTP